MNYFCNFTKGTCRGTVDKFSPMFSNANLFSFEKKSHEKFPEYV